MSNTQKIVKNTVQIDDLFQEQLKLDVIEKVDSIIALFLRGYNISAIFYTFFHNISFVFT